MVNKFEVGKWYRLNDEYPELVVDESITTPHGETNWKIEKYNGFKHGRPRKCSEELGCWVIFEGVKGGSWLYQPGDFVEVAADLLPTTESSSPITITGTLLCGKSVNDSLDLLFGEETKMDIKTMNKDNVKEALTKYEEETDNAEIQNALEQLRTANDELNRIDREIKTLEEEKQPHKDVIKLFKK